jgi:murein DD-endopeptidase MepM/ murein hydrolase activator NlpD
LRHRSIVYVTQREDGAVERVSIPMRYVYVFVAAAVTGMFTIAGMAGSYSRMLVKTERFNGVRDQLAMTRKDYAGLEKKSHERDVQAASLGSLASEVSAIYGLTAGRLTHIHTVRGAKAGALVVADGTKVGGKDDASTFTDESYYKSLETFVALEKTASQGLSLQPAADTRLGVRSRLSDFDSTDLEASGNVPDMWPIMGPINSGFGEREDPILGNGSGEFHKGIDIGGPDGTPVHAPAGGRVIRASVGNGYGREVQIDHGNGIVTLYAHLQGFNVVEGQVVVKGEVIGYVGHSGSRVTGPNLHYEVQIHGTAVNPHKYLRTTLAQLGGAGSGGM